MPPVTPIGTPLIQLDQVDSSNNYAMAQVQAQLAAHGTTWLAKHQTAGRGQRGKLWQASPGENIIMSTVVVPSVLKIENQFFLSIVTALACYDFFSSHALHYTSIKWPNDIYWKDRKAGGVLIENILQGSEWKYAIVGIGININQTSFEDGLQNPVSLKQITGKQYEIISLAIELCDCLENRWRQLVSGQMVALLAEYNQHLFKINEVVTFKKDNAEIQAHVLGINENGELLIDTGSIVAVPFGGVEWIIG